MTDIVERLRNTLTGSDGARQTLNEAVAEIEHLRAEVDRLVKSRNKWGQKYNQTLEKLKLAVWTDTEEVKAANEACVEFKQRAEAAEARLAEAVEVVREFHDAAQIDAVMEGPRLTGWNRSALNRAWPKATAFLAKLEEKP